MNILPTSNYSQHAQEFGQATVLTQKTYYSSGLRKAAQKTFQRILSVPCAKNAIANAPASISILPWQSTNRLNVHVIGIRRNNGKRIDWRPIDDTLSRLNKSKNKKELISQAAKTLAKCVNAMADNIKIGE